MQAKENILRRIRQALHQQVTLPFPEAEGKRELFAATQDDLAVLFAEEFTKLGGKFAFCSGVADLEAQLRLLFANNNLTKIYTPHPEARDILDRILKASHPELADCDASLTFCEKLVARTGSIMLSSKLHFGRTASVYAPVHICIATVGQIVFDIQDALDVYKQVEQTEMPSFLTFATGPSRTADIEKTLVTGVHGPKEVYCFLLDTA